MTSMAHSPSLSWDFTDSLQSPTRQVVINGEAPEMIWYVYDAQGTRVRKIVDAEAQSGSQPVKRKETIYLEGSDIFRKYGSAGQEITFERQTTIVKATSLIATVETRTIGDEQRVCQ